MGVLALATVAAGADEDASRSNPPELYAKVGEGIVRAVSTGLEWTARDNGVEVDWHAGGRYCQGLLLDGRADWRLPSIEELATLYHAGADAPCGDATCHLGAPIRLTSPYLWSDSPKTGDRRFYFDFRFGTRLAPRLRGDLTRRVLCARSI